MLMMICAVVEIVEIVVVDCGVPYVVKLLCTTFACVGRSDGCMKWGSSSENIRLVFSLMF